MTTVRKRLRPHCPRHRRVRKCQVPYKGSVVPILRRICGHLRLSVSYAGESSLADAREKIVSDVLSYFVRLSGASRAESFER